MGEPVKHLLDALVPVALLHADPVVEVERIAQGKILEEGAAVQGGGTIELGNQGMADLHLHRFWCGQDTRQLPCVLKGVQVEINTRGQIKPDRVVRYEEMCFAFR